MSQNKKCHSPTHTIGSNNESCPNSKTGELASKFCGMSVKTFADMF